MADTLEATTSVSRRLRLSRLARREAIDGFVFIMPWLLGFILWIAGPMIASLVLSFMKWDLFNPPKWAGFSTDMAFHSSTNTHSLF